MRIGQVSKKYNISIDNLYYYINYGLLVPKKPQGQYYFDEQTLGDLESILEYKEMGFSLKEIHEIISLYRISGLASDQDISDLEKIYQGRLSTLNKEKKRITQSINDLSAKINELKLLHPDSGTVSGVPVNMLDYLCCPICGKPFSIENANMNHKFIFYGNIKCECGYSATIENGVLLTPNKNKDLYDTPDIDRKLYRDTPPSLISLFERSYNWMLGKIHHMDLSGKVVLETYINAWFFIQNHQGDLDSKAKYIIVDKYPEMLYMYKTLMQNQGHNLDILFIADSSTNLPLRKNCVDLNIDYFAVNEHNFYHNTFLYDELLPYLNDKAYMLGTYFYFEKGKKSMETLLREYPTCSPNNFSISYFMDNMKQYKTEYEDCGFTTSSGENIGFSFHQDGEKMYLRSYLTQL